MKKPMFGLLLALAFCLVSVSLASATDVTVPFPTAGDAYCSATNGCGTIPAGGQTGYMWTAGDYVVSSNFTGTGLNSVMGLTYNFQIQNFLSGYNEVLDVLVNNTVVGTITAMDSNDCGCYQTLSGSLSFGAVPASGGGFTLEMMLTNTIPGGGGSIAFTDGGQFTLQSSGGGGTTPEPGSILLFGTGVLAIAGMARRKMGL